MFLCRRKKQFWRACRNIPTKFRKTFAPSPEIEKSTFSFLKKYFFQKCSFGIVEVQKSYQRLSVKMLVKFFAHSAKVMKRNLDFFEKVSNYSSGDVKSSFHKPAGNFHPKSEFFQLKDWKRLKLTYSFFRKKFLKTFLWTRRIRFSSTLLKFFCQIPKCFRSKYVKDRKLFVRPKKHQNASLHTSIAIWQPFKSFCCQETEIFFGDCTKVFNNLFFQRINFSSNRFTEDVKCCFGKPADNCRGKTEEFWPKSENQKSFVFFSAKKVPQNGPPDTWNAKLTTQLKPFSKSLI